MYAEARRDMRAGRPRDLGQSVSPPRFQAKFHLGFPKSSRAEMSSYSLAVSPAHSPKNEPIVYIL